jgi:hypothetical protein
MTIPIADIPSGDAKESAMRRILAAAIWIGLVIATGTADAQSVAPPGPRFTLSGVVVVEGGGRAWLQEPVLTQDQIVGVRPGESIGPYRLTKILEDRVELAGPTGTFSVLLAGTPGPAAVAAPVAPRPQRQLTPPSSNDPNDPNRVVILPPGPPLAPLPAGTPRVDFGSLLRGVTPSR